MAAAEAMAEAVASSVAMAMAEAETMAAASTAAMAMTSTAAWAEGGEGDAQLAQMNAKLDGLMRGLSRVEEGFETLTLEGCGTTFVVETVLVEETGEQVLLVTRGSDGNMFVVESVFDVESGALANTEPEILAMVMREDVFGAFVLVAAEETMGGEYMDMLLCAQDEGGERMRTLTGRRLL